MNALFETPTVSKQIRTHDGRFATSRQADIDRKFMHIQKVENENHRLKRQLVEAERTANALRKLFAQHERHFKGQSMMKGFAGCNNVVETTHRSAQVCPVVFTIENGAIVPIE